MINKDHIIATLTNIAYGYAGWQMLAYSADLLVPAIACFALMLGSGYHHWHLKSWSRKYDYIGMYMVISSLLALGLGLSASSQMAVMVTLGMALYIFFKSNELVIGAGIGVLLVMVHILAPVGQALYLMFIMSLAYGFNFIGDKLHKKNHDLIHSIWHVCTAFGIFEVVKMLIQ